MLGLLYRYTAGVGLLLLLTTTGYLLAQPVSSSAETGVIAGEIYHAGTTRAIRRALVSVEGTMVSTITTDDGRFRIQGLPPGMYRLNVSAWDYERETVDEILVSVGKSTQLRIALHVRTILTRDPVSSVEKRNQPYVQASATVSVVNASELYHRNSVTLDQALQHVPAVHLNGSLLNIRGSNGFMPWAGNRTQLLIDGIPHTAPDDGRILYDAIPVGAIEQVEVVRGPSSALYGSGAIAGVVNVITRRAETGPKARIAAFAGLYTDPGHTDWKWWGQNTQHFNGVDGVWAGSSGDIRTLLTGSYRRDEGYRQNDNNEGYNLFGSLGWNLDSQTTLHFTGLTTGDHHGGYVNWVNLDSALFSSTANEVTSHTKATNSAINAAVHHQIDDDLSYRLRSSLHTTNLSDNRADNDPNRRDGSTNSFFTELQIISSLNKRVVFHLGGTAQYESVTSILYGNHDRRSLGLYAQMEFSNREDISGVIQARLDRIDQMGNNSGETHLSPRIGITYSPTEESSMRVMLGRGFRMPTVAEQYINAPNNPVPLTPNINLRTEQNWHGEMGATQSFEFSEITLIADCALYVDEYFSMIEPVLATDGSSIQFDNLTRARILGVDFQVQGLVPELSLSFAADITNLAAQDLKRHIDLVSRPSTMGHFYLSWQTGALVVGMDYRYIARFDRIDTALIVLIPDANWRSATNNVDLTASFDLQTFLSIPITARMKARNIFQHYATEGVGSIAPIRNFEFGMDATF